MYPQSLTPLSSVPHTTVLSPMLAPVRLCFCREASSLQVVVDHRSSPMQRLTQQSRNDLLHSHSLTPQRSRRGVTIGQPSSSTLFRSSFCSPCAFSCCVCTYREHRLTLELPCSWPLIRCGAIFAHRSLYILQLCTDADHRETAAGPLTEGRWRPPERLLPIHIMQSISSTKGTLIEAWWLG